jgi:nickel/cobalt exporter
MIARVFAELLSLWHWLVGLQREILSEVASTFRVFAETGDWAPFLAFAPWAITFGAAHALTPGHSKTVLAFWLAGTGAHRGEALRTAFALAATHIGLSVLIVLIALPVVTMARGEAGRAPLLEDISRALLGISGLWLIWQGIRGHQLETGRPWFGVAAGLVPCPLTLFVMTFAAARGVTAAGVGFAALTMLGVALVLGTVALAASTFGQSLLALSRGTMAVSRFLLILSGLFLLGAAAIALTA